MPAIHNTSPSTRFYFSSPAKSRWVRVTPLPSPSSPRTSNPALLDPRVPSVFGLSHCPGSERAASAGDERREGRVRAWWIIERERMKNEGEERSGESWLKWSYWIKSALCSCHRLSSHLPFIFHGGGLDRRKIVDSGSLQFWHQKVGVKRWIGGGDK